MKINNLKKGFTLIELLVVVAIIGVLMTVTVLAVNSAKNKGADAAIKSNLNNAMKQAEIFYNSNTAAPNTYTDICTNGQVGGARGIGEFILQAAKARSLSTYSINPSGAGDLTTAKCKQLVPGAWAAEVPLSTAGNMWCVDSTGASKLEVDVSLGSGSTCI
jgi:prepilin-type N-terminal cleavage/methylation domain-containing protein